VAQFSVGGNIDGQELKVRTRGPLMLVYPFDDNQKLQDNIYYGRAVWQLVSIAVE
jgi:hypothetical protein